MIAETKERENKDEICKLAKIPDGRLNINAVSGTGQSAVVHADNQVTSTSGKQCQLSQFVQFPHNE